CWPASSLRRRGRPLPNHLGPEGGRRGPPATRPIGSPEAGSGPLGGYVVAAARRAQAMCAIGLMAPPLCVVRGCTSRAALYMFLSCGTRGSGPAFLTARLCTVEFVEP
ncbi:unnamed protein product, partial [Amoebophrya sp. A120]